MVYRADDAVRQIRLLDIRYIVLRQLHTECADSVVEILCLFTPSAEGTSRPGQDVSVKVKTTENELYTFSGKAFT